MSKEYIDWEMLLSEGKSGYFNDISLKISLNTMIAQQWIKGDMNSL
ncbi:hypothetical protein [Commensalibacter nepenthis]|uniref:Uncharacterized protein n=1 Tax=Commensalibacter nepenthis TaxID=3043872 RepID=A0ABT6Q9Y9_9PROT|nr:hypothetical protein [Commensalibacter sp. TBRC 10068]MDI2113130.1 hypothetical protein [Commensalibacter sp. TBRC 10068]